MIPILALTFFCGASYELGCVFWVHYSERGRVKLAVVWSMFNALVTVVGIGEAAVGIGDAAPRPLVIAAYVIGYGAGTWLALVIKRRMATK